VADVQLVSHSSDHGGGQEMRSSDCKSQRAVTKFYIESPIGLDANSVSRCGGISLRIRVAFN